MEDNVIRGAELLTLLRINKLAAGTTNSDDCCHEILRAPVKNRQEGDLASNKFISLRVAVTCLGLLL